MLFDHLPVLLSICYEIILDRNGILWVCKRISDASNSKMSHDVIYDPSVVGSRLDHRGLKLDGAIGQGKICNSLKTEKFSKSFLSHIGKNKIKF